MSDNDAIKLIRARMGEESEGPKIEDSEEAKELWRVNAELVKAGFQPWAYETFAQQVGLLREQRDLERAKNIILKDALNGYADSGHWKHDESTKNFWVWAGLHIGPYAARNALEQVSGLAHKLSIFFEK